ncbi:MAG: MFS transporter [Phenylobacterium sp.]|uniref:MFS transporter n=1 Tax=Phenylobacterium sp. TaxID=1871053 RepID=UPI001A632488|nr:MFS transporter [Phenylobacterium sp.]MBL8553575.1 MFS transporter [Phenylobacterium sp.]
MASQGTSSGSQQTLSLPLILAFASASIPIQALVLAISVHLPRYFASHVGLELAAVGAAFAMVRLIDIPIDVMLGTAMDRTRTRFGRYRVWMLAGTPVLMAGCWLLLQANSTTSQLGLSGILLFLYIGYSMMYLSHLAWGGVLGPTYEQRSKVFGAIIGLGVVGAVIVLGIPIVMDELGHTDGEGVRAMVWFIIGATPVTALLVLLSTREKITPETGKAFRPVDYLTLLKRGNVLRLLAADLCVTLGPGWMAALYLFYFKDSRGFDTTAANLLLMIYIGAGFVGAPFAAWLANKIGKHRALMVTTTIYSLGLVLIPFLPKGNFLVFSPGMFVVGAMAAGFGVMIRALTGDIADEIRLDTGREWMGLMYALTIGTTKIASGLSALTFVLLAYIGYQAKAGAVNTPQAIQSLELVYIVGPIVFVMIAGACFIGYKLTPERHADIRRQLDERDALSEGGASALESLTGDTELVSASRPS